MRWAVRHAPHRTHTGNLPQRHRNLESVQRRQTEKEAGHFALKVINNIKARGLIGISRLKSSGGGPCNTAQGTTGERAGEGGEEKKRDCETKGVLVIIECDDFLRGFGGGGDSG
jgi:hypothetical protein